MLSMNHEISGSSGIQVGILNEIYGERLDTLSEKLHDFFYSYEFNSHTAITELLQMPHAKPQKLIDTLLPRSTGELNLPLDEQSADARPPEPPRHFDSSLQEDDSDGIVTPNAIRSLLSSSHEMKSWFGFEYDQILAYQTLFLSMERYGGDKESISLMLASLEDLFYDMLAISSLCRVSKAPRYDFTLALYRMYFIMFRQGSLIDTGLGEFVYFPSERFEPALAEENLQTFPTVCC